MKKTIAVLVAALVVIFATTSVAVGAEKPLPPSHFHGHGEFNIVKEQVEPTETTPGYIIYGCEGHYGMNGEGWKHGQGHFIRVDIPALGESEEPSTDEPEVTPEEPSNDEPEVTPEEPSNDEPEVTPEEPKKDEPEVTPEEPTTDEPEVTPEEPTTDEPEVTPEEPYIGHSGWSVGEPPVVTEEDVIDEPEIPVVTEDEEWTTTDIYLVTEEYYDCDCDKKADVAKEPFHSPKTGDATHNTLYVIIFLAAVAAFIYSIRIYRVKH